LTAPQQAQARSNIGVPTPIPSGTVMLFYQASAPVGWTQVTTQNDKALRVVSGSGGVAGGTNPFSTVMAQTATGNHTLTLSEIASGINSSGANTITGYLINNPSVYAPVIGGANWTADSFYPPGATWIPVSNTGSVGNAAYTQYSNTIYVASTNTGGGAHNHPITMAIQYCDVIICSKN
jgi:hypothetical protein